MDEIRAEVALDLTLDGQQSIPESENPYEKTFLEWYNHLRKTIYVFNYVLEKKKRRLNRLSIAVTVSGAVASLIVVSQFGIDQCQYTNVLISLQVILVVSSLTSTILSGIINIYGLNETVNTLQRFLDSANSLFTILATEQMLPQESQSDKKELILLNRSRYVEIIQNAPHIDTSAYLEGLANYETSSKQFKK